MSKFFLLFSFSVAALTANAQNTALLRGANKAFESGDYYNAALRYEEYLGFRKGGATHFMPYAPQLLHRKGVDDTKALQQLAEAYRRLPDYAAAEKYYTLLLNNNSAALIDARIAYASVLRANGKGVSVGMSSLQDLLKRTDLSADQRTAAERELQTIRFGAAAMNAPEVKLFTITQKTDINSGSGDYAAVQQNGTTYFTSTRREDTSHKKAASNSLYVTGTGGAQKLSLSTVAVHNGTPTLSADGNTLYFTAWEGKGDRSVSAIYQTTRSGNSWSEPVKLSTIVNADGSNSRQPWVVTVGGKQRLYFSSNRQGGQGGYDIWYTEIGADGQPRMAVNAGATINTADDEGSPFYHEATNTLVFASNGHPGMGGFDLFAAKGSEAPMNMGYPVNSVRDDLYFFSSGDSLFTNALLSSDRLSDCCLQTFAVSKAGPPREGQHFITGSITDCATGMPIANSTIKVGSQETVTDANGQFGLKLIASTYQQLTVTANKQSYASKDTAIVNNTDPTADANWTLNLCLTPPLTATAASEPIVLFDFDKATLSQYACRQLDSVAKALQANPSFTVAITGYTDAKGGERYNNRLADRRATACKAYLISKGIAANRLEAIAKGSCCPVAPDAINGVDNPEGRRLNRRVEIQLQ